MPCSLFVFTLYSHLSLSKNLGARHLAHVYTYEMNGIFHSYDQSIYMHMHCDGTNTCSSTFIHLYTFSKYGSPCR
jgi:hypothetical protein